MNQEKKTFITKVAQQIFRQYGFIKTTVDDIAKAARIGKASIYHYFKSKEDIFNNVVELEYHVLTREAENVVALQDDPRKKIKKFVMQRQISFNKLTNIYNALEDDFWEHSAFTKRIRKRYLESEQQVMKAILHQGIEQGIFEIKDMDLTAAAILLAMKGLENPMDRIQDPGPLEDKLDKLLDILFNGIVKQ